MGVAEAQFGPVLPQEIVDKVEDYEIMDEAQQEAAEEKEKEKFAALTFLEGANRARYGRMTTELSNDFVKGATTYPETVEDALEMLST